MLRSSAVARAGPSIQLEIFALLPLGHFELEAIDLGLFDRRIVVNEAVAEAGTKARARAERIERLVERLRQQLRLGLVRRVGGGPGIELAGDAVEPGDDLRGHVEIGVGCGLADAVLKMSRRIARPA